MSERERFARAALAETAQEEKCDDCGKGIARHVLFSVCDDCFKAEARS